MRAKGKVDRERGAGVVEGSPPRPQTRGATTGNREEFAQRASRPEDQGTRGGGSAGKRGARRSPGPLFSTPSRTPMPRSLRADLTGPLPAARRRTPP